jgi:hypothetical protein
MIGVFRGRAVAQAWHAGTVAVVCLLLNGMLAAQPPKARVSNAPPTSEGLNLLVLEGQGAVNDIRMPKAMTLVIEVRDDNYRPLEGAAVDFQLPPKGPSGSFDGELRNKQVVTNVQGQAAAVFTPNTERGRFTIQTKASFGARTGMASIMQRNGQPESPTWINRHKTLMILIAAGVAGGATAAVLRTGGGSSSASSKPTVTITSGIPTFGSPQ